MAAIPLPEPNTDVRSAGGINVYADANTFGAGTGRAVQQLGQSISQIGAVLSAKRKQQEELLRNENVASNVANSSIEFAKVNAQAQTEAAPDGAGTMDAVVQKQRDIIEAQAANIKDPIARTEYKTRMNERLATYAQNNVEFEVNRHLNFQTETSNFALNGLENSIRSDANNFDNAHKDGIAIIESQHVPEAQKIKMKMDWTQRTAYARFQSLISGAKSPAEFDAITKQAGDRRWVDAFAPNEYQAMLTDIKQAKAAYTTRADTEARSLLDGAEARTAKLVVIGQDEMKQIVGQAEQSSNPITLKRAMRLQRDQQIIERSKKLPAAELDARSNSIIQNGFPGLNADMSNAAEAVASQFKGVSSSYLSNLVNQEYGVYLPKGVTGSAKFRPVAANARVDIRNLKTYVQDAAATAGEIYGKPLVLYSAFRSQAHQDSIRFAPGKNPFRRSVAVHSHHTQGDGIDVATAGMSGAEKGKLVDALVQAGFTGFGEYDTHIHADMRQSTTSGFNPATRELGWSKGSPEVIQALVNRGYAAGIPASELRRGDAARRNVAAVDYGKGPVGGGTTAIGVTQFETGTWLSLANDPTVAKRVGIDPNLSEEQVLALRKDPVMSMRMAAVYAEQNRKILEPSLGRRANDAELYMAHFLGPGGAQTLISAYEHNPDGNAAALLPKAAENNKSRFYDKSGKPLSVKEVYDNIAVQFTANPSQVQFDDAQTYKNMADASRKAEANDPMTQYGNNVAPVGNLQGEGAFAARGTAALTAADLYSIPIEDMKPFTETEAQGLTKTFSEGDVQTKLSVIANINELDSAAPGLAAAAFKQIGQKDTVFSQAGAIANERGDTVTAETIVRGQDRLTKDKTLGDTLFKNSDALNTFNEATGGALQAVPPETRAAIFEAAKAHYAETASQKGVLEFNADAFKQSVAKVTGGQDGGIADVNGKPTVMPKGVDPVTFNTAVDKLTDDDLVKFGADSKPPIDISGDVVSAHDVSTEGEFVFIGADKYKIRMLDGGFLTTGDRVSGMLKAYVFDGSKENLVEIANRQPDAQDGSNDPYANPLGLGGTSAN